MSFFPVKYFLKKFFPASWFGGGAETGTPQFGDMAATMSGSGTMTGRVSATATIGCTMAGAGSMTGELSATVRQVTLLPSDLTISAAGGWHSHDKERERQTIYGDMAATITGSGKMTGSLRASGALTCTMVGKGSMRAMPVLDITRLLQRRAEEEEMMAMILTAVG